MLCLSRQNAYEVVRTLRRPPPRGGERGGGPSTLSAPVVILGEFQKTRHPLPIKTRRRQVRQRLTCIATIEVEIAVQIRPVILELLQNKLFQRRRIGQTRWSNPLHALQRQQFREDAL